MVDLDFTAIEQLRKSMMLRKQDMASLIGTTRWTYDTWIKGVALRKGNRRRVEIVLTKFYNLMCDGWPTPTVIPMTGKMRFEVIKKLMDEMPDDIKLPVEDDDEVEF